VTYPGESAGVPDRPEPATSARNRAAPRHGSRRRRQAPTTAGRDRGARLCLPGPRPRWRPGRDAAVGTVAPGKYSLVIYSMMVPRDPGDDRPGPAGGQTALLPLAQSPCPSCTAFLDALDGAARHASQRVNLAAAGKAPIERILTFGAERGWRHLQLLSTAGTTYNCDYLAETPAGDQQPMLNVFHRDGNTIRHFWGTELFYAPEDRGQDQRHVGTLEPLWNLFDLTPEGRPAGWYEQLRY